MSDENTAPAVNPTLMELEELTEALMVEELVGHHGLLSYANKKIETTHWLKDELMKLVIAAREVEKVIAENQGPPLSEMTKEDMGAELEFRRVEFDGRLGEDKRKDLVREWRIRFAMVALGFETNPTVADHPSQKAPIEETPPAQADGTSVLSEEPLASQAPLTGEELKRAIDKAVSNLITPAAMLDIKSALSTGRGCRMNVTLLLPHGNRVHLSALISR